MLLFLVYLALCILFFSFHERSTVARQTLTSLRSNVQQQCAHFNAIIDIQFEALESLAGAVRGLDIKKIVTVVIILVVCIVVMKILLKILDRTFRRLEMDRGLHTFVRAAVRVILWLITACLVLGYIGIPMTSFVAVLSVMGLAVTLAIQGTLSNLAGGIQVLASKPFKADDYIDAG